MQNALISEVVKIVQGLAPVADAFAGTVTSDVVNLENYERVAFLVNKGVGLTGTSTITVQASAAADGGSPTAIAFKYRLVDFADGTENDKAGTITDATTAGFVTTAGSTQIYIIEVKASDLPAAKPFVHLKAVEVVDSPVAGSILVLLANPRFEGATMPTAIS